VLGPVFERELTSTARSPRSFALRSAFTLVMLAVVAATCRGEPGADPRAGSVTAARAKALAGDLFRNLILTQGVAVVLLTPALVAGAIAGEVERKTLHDLLTSGLTGGEIVLDKLAARLLHVGVLLLAGLPILVPAGLLGGLDPRLILVCELATLSTALFLAGLSVLASTQARTVRGAMNLVFTFTMVWLVLPASVALHLPRSGAAGLWLHGWVAPANAWFAPSSPFSLLLNYLGGAVRGPEAMTRRVLTMAGLQVVYGLALTVLAVVRLRPSYRAHQGGGRQRGAAGAGRARRRRCGDDPMIWKELFVASAPTPHRHLGLSAALVLGGVLAWGSAEFALPAFREAWSHGYGVAPPGSARGLFHLYLRVVATGTALAFLLGTAADAAAGMTSERERDTWVSLVATPLTGGEIVRAKLLGAVWGARHAAAVAALLGLAGVLAGSVHPAGLVLAAAELSAYAAFAAALGTWVSLRSADTMRSAAGTVAGLMLAGVGPMVVLASFSVSRPLALAGCAPVMLAASLASPAEVLGRPTPNRFGALSDAPVAELWAGRGPKVWLGGLASATAYAAAAWALTRASCRGFDKALDRPPVTGPPGRGGVSDATSRQPEPWAASPSVLKSPDSTGLQVWGF